MTDYSDLVEKIESYCKGCEASACLYSPFHPKIVQLNLNDEDHKAVICSHIKSLRDWIETRLTLNMLESMYGKGK